MMGGWGEEKEFSKFLSGWFVGGTETEERRRRVGGGGTEAEGRRRMSGGGGAENDRKP